MPDPAYLQLIRSLLRIDTPKPSTPEQRSEYELEIGPVEVEDSDDDTKDLVS